MDDELGPPDASSHEPGDGEWGDRHQRVEMHTVVVPDPPGNTRKKVVTAARALLLWIGISWSWALYQQEPQMFRRSASNFSFAIVWGAMTFVLLAVAGRELRNLLDAARGIEHEPLRIVEPGPAAAWAPPGQPQQPVVMPHAGPSVPPALPVPPIRKQLAEQHWTTSATSAGPSAGPSASVLLPALALLVASVALVAWIHAQGRDDAVRLHLDQPLELIVSLLVVAAWWTPIALGGLAFATLRELLGPSRADRRRARGWWSPPRSIRSERILMAMAIAVPASGFIAASFGWRLH